MICVKVQSTYGEGTVDTESWANENQKGTVL